MQDQNRKCSGRVGLDQKRESESDQDEKISCYFGTITGAFDTTLFFGRRGVNPVVLETMPPFGEPDPILLLRFRWVKKMGAKIGSHSAEIRARLLCLSNGRSICNI